MSKDPGSLQTMISAMERSSAVVVVGPFAPSLMARARSALLSTDEITPSGVASAENWGGRLFDAMKSSAQRSVLGSGSGWLFNDVGTSPLIGPWLVIFAGMLNAEQQ
jgi:hypothetical protein